MTSTELDRVLTAVNTSIEASRQDRIASDYIRRNIRDIVKRLRHEKSTTFRAGNQTYQVNREQVGEALREAIR